MWDTIIKYLDLPFISHHKQKAVKASMKYVVMKCIVFLCEKHDWHSGGPADNFIVSNVLINFEYLKVDWTQFIFGQNFDHS